VRVVSSAISRQAAARGVLSEGSMPPEIGARWCLEECQYLMGRKCPVFFCSLVG
jgi:hypothetical protein